MLRVSPNATELERVKQAVNEARVAACMTHVQYHHYHYFVQGSFEKTTDANAVSALIGHWFRVLPKFVDRARIRVDPPPPPSARF